MVLNRIYFFFGFTLLLASTQLGLAQNVIVEIRDLEKKYEFSDVNYLLEKSEDADSFNENSSIVQPWLKGLHALHSSNHNEAYKWLFEAYTKSKLSSNKLLTAEITLDLAKTYSMLELMSRSLALLLEVEGIFLTNGTDEQKARFYIQLGELHRRMFDFDEGLDRLYDAEQYIDSNMTLRCQFLNRKAAIFTEKNNHEEAKRLSKEALSIAKRLNNPDLKATSYNELAFLDKHTRSQDSVFRFYTIADSLWYSIGKLRYVAETRLALSIWYGTDSTMRDLSKSLEIAYSASSLAKDKSWDFLEFDIYKHISNLHLEFKAIDSAQFYTIKSYDAYLRYLEKRNDLESLIVQSEYKQEKSENIIRDQRMKLLFEKEQNESMRKESTLYFFLFLVLLLVVFLMVWILNLNRSKRKKAFEIAKQEAATRLSLEQNLEEKNILLAEVNHRVKNNLQAMSSLVDLQRISESSLKAKESLLELQRRIDAMGIIHEMLYANEFINKLDVRMYIQHLIDSEKLIYEGINQGISFDLEVESMDLDIDQCINLGMIVSEFISNSFKHAFTSTAHPKITIILKRVEEKIHLVISDNGKGILEKELEQFASKSLGLKLISIFCKKLDGNQVMTGSAYGTKLEITFPIRMK